VIALSLVGSSFNKPNYEIKVASDCVYDTGSPTSEMGFGGTFSTWLGVIHDIDS